MRTRRLVNTIAGISIAVIIGLGGRVSFALDYFGDIDANKMVLKIESSQTRQPPSMLLEFPFYLVLQNGTPRLSQQPEVTDRAKKGRLDIVNMFNVPFEDPLPGETTEAFRERMRTKATHTQHLLFEFSSSGWPRDSYVVRIVIPYTISREDELQMLQLASEGTVETRWRDPKNGAVTVVSGGRQGPIRVTVLESTLGFGNKPNRKRMAPSDH